MTERPTTVWDADNPRLQRYWDSTALRSLLACPYRYYLSNVEGWQTTGQMIDADFGRIAGEGLEVFYKGIIEKGLDHDTALRHALRTVLQESWDDTCDKPRLGNYEAVWHCKGTEKFKNAKGNAAKCPFSHKGKYWAAPGPAYCGQCGSECETWQQWLPANPAKDRYQLVRLIVWYSEEVKEGYLKPVSFQDTPDSPHRALVEVPWTLPIGRIGGKDFYLCGWFDAVKAVGGAATEAYVTDYKTTKNTLGPQFFAPFAPDIQVSVYDLAGSQLFKEVLPFEGVAIEGISVTQSGVQFGFQVFRKTPEQRAELVKELQTYLTMALQYAEHGYWPMNRASCFLCQFKKVCATTPADRGRVLEANFERSRWNPLLRRRESVTGNSATADEAATTIVAGDSGTQAADGSVA